ncbi:TPA: ESPR-type extended signal peptide-containing protein, partial [Neisseria subflava]
MNKIYKIVWNAAQEAWVAVSELAKGHVKASSSGKNAKQSTVVEEEGSTSFTLYSLGKAAANAMVIGGVAVTLFSLSQTAQAADKHETPVVAQQGTREKAQGQEPNALLALGNDTYAGGRSTVVIGESSRLNGTVAMALGNGINIDHGIAPQSVFLGKSIDDRYNQDKPRGKKQSQYVKSQVIGSDIYFGGLTNNKVDGLNQATLMGNNIKHLSEEQSNSMMTASNFVFRGIKAQDSAVNGHGITVNLNSSAKRAVLNRSSITGTNININSTGDINEMLVSGTTISVTRQNNALGGALVGNNINFDSTGATVNTEKVNYVGQDINVTASSTSNPLFGQGIALHNSNLSGAPTFGQNIKSSNSAISNTLTQGYNTTFNGATVNDSVLTVNNATITGRLTNATLMGRDINTSGNVADTQVVGNRNTVTASNTQVLGSGITANVNNSVYLGDGSEVEAKGVGEKVAINIKTEGRTAGTSDYLEQLIHDGTRARFAGGTGVSGAVTVGNATNTRRIQHVAPGYYDANSTDAVNGSQLYAVGQSAGNAYFKAVEAAKAAKAADDKAVAAQARADAAHSLATTANTAANNALNKANAADAKAVSAQADATKAKSDAAAAKNDAGQALTKAGEAKTAAAAADTKAGQALTKAGEAAQAAAAADTKAGEAKTAAAAADTKAGQAKTAAAAADTKAGQALTKAGEAAQAAAAADTKAGKAQKR